ncbi:MAG: hypothetical protein HY644_12890 [Acidobacteria bacterium]|nr:hypothetical protein [Acidobacteriota bacterium]
MSRWEAWLFHILTAVVSLTGAVYFWMKNLMETDDPFSLVNHPLQPFMLSIHILSAPLLVFAVGIIFNSHIASKLRKANGGNRRSGMASLFSFLPMVISGYLLQVSSDATVHRLALVLHLATGAIFVTTYLAHQVISFRLSRRYLPESSRNPRVAQQPGMSRCRRLAGSAYD